MRVKASDWKKKEKLINAGTKGFNYQDELPKMFKEEIPEFRDFRFGFCDEGNLAHWKMTGWSNLSTSDFDSKDEFNKVAHMGLQITEHNGALMIMDNYIMIQPLDFAQRVQDLRNEEAEALERVSLDRGDGYLPPGYDPDKMGVKSSVERSKVIAKGQKTQPDVKQNRRGRPPGSKNKKG